MATVAHSIPHFRANPETLLRRLIDRWFPTAVVPSITPGAIAGEINLIVRRLEALQGSAPTWHPLHLQRVVERTVIVPLHALLPLAQGRTADGIRDALWELDACDSADAALQVLDEAALLLRSVLRELGR